MEPRIIDLTHTTYTQESEQLTQDTHPCVGRAGRLSTATEWRVRLIPLTNPVSVSRFMY